ncbi:MAG: type 1 glutamine amidotransferase [Desulfovibrionales bacterium]|nr:type 1 glutamine amidotransferase [Desulfovibrionales bacterium]
MKVHVLQHVAFEGIGSMEGWLKRRAATVTHTRFFTSPALPANPEFDLVIAMGGPMSVHDEAEFPWLAEEKRFLRAAMERQVPVLGVCLGAQLIASALEARVCQGREKEIGWFDVEGQPAADAFCFPERIKVFHWHGETFDLPPGAQHLARSAACFNQAFAYRRNVLGLQFHLEATPASIEAMIAHCGRELIPAPFVQGREEIQSATAQDFQRINTLMEDVLDYLAPR